MLKKADHIKLSSASVYPALVPNQLEMAQNQREQNQTQQQDNNFQRRRLAHHSNSFTIVQSIAVHTPKNGQNGNDHNGQTNQFIHNSMVLPATGATTFNKFKGFFLPIQLKKFVMLLKQSSSILRFKQLGPQQFEIIADAASDYCYYYFGNLLNMRPSFTQRSLNTMNRSVSRVYHKGNSFVKSKLLSLLKFEAIIFPNSAVKILIDFITLLFLLLNIIYIPLELSFSFDREDLNAILNVATGPLSIFIFLSEIICRLNTDILAEHTFNILLFCYSSAIYVNGLIIDERKEITKYYFKHLLLWDMLIIIPLVLGIYFKVWILKLMIVFRFFDIRALVLDVEDRFQLKDRYRGQTQLVKLLFFILCLAHLIACTWNKLGLFEFDNGSEVTWIGKATDSQNLEFLSQYIRSFYWTVVTMTTIGYGDITPVTAIEQVFAISIVLLSTIVFGFSISSIGEVLREISRKESEFRLKMSTVESYMDRRRLSQQLQVKVRKYFDYLHQEEQEDTHEGAQLLHKLAQSLKEEVFVDMYGKLLKSKKLFSLHFSTPFLNQLALKMKEQRFGPEEIIFNEKQQANRIYFILKGEVQMLLNLKQDSQQYRVLCTLKEGQIFGEVEFFSGLARKHTAKTVNVTSVVYVEFSEFIETVKAFPEDYEQVVQTRDNINLYSKSKGLDHKCLSCGSFEHLINSCPLVNYIPNYTKIMHNYNLQYDQPRKDYNDRKDFKCDNSLSQIKYLKQAAMSLHFNLYDERILNEGEMSQLEINGGSNEDEDESEREDGEEEEEEELHQSYIYKQQSPRGLIERSRQAGMDLPRGFLLNSSFIAAETPKYPSKFSSMGRRIPNATKKRFVKQHCLLQSGGKSLPQQLIAGNDSGRELENEVTEKDPIKDLNQLTKEQQNSNEYNETENDEELQDKSKKGSCESEESHGGGITYTTESDQLVHDSLEDQMKISIENKFFHKSSQEINQMKSSIDAACAMIKSSESQQQPLNIQCNTQTSIASGCSQISSHFEGNIGQEPLLSTERHKNQMSQGSITSNKEQSRQPYATRRNKKQSFEKIKKNVLSLERVQKSQEKEKDSPEKEYNEYLRTQKKKQQFQQQQQQSLESGNRRNFKHLRHNPVLNHKLSLEEIQSLGSSPEKSKKKEQDSDYAGSKGLIIKQIPLVSDWQLDGNLYSQKEKVEKQGVRNPKKYGNQEYLDEEIKVEQEFSDKDNGYIGGDKNLNGIDRELSKRQQFTGIGWNIEISRENNWEDTLSKPPLLSMNKNKSKGLNYEMTQVQEGNANTKSQENHITNNTSKYNDPQMTKIPDNHKRNRPISSRDFSVQFLKLPEQSKLFQNCEVSKSDFMLNPNINPSESTRRSIFQNTSLISAVEKLPQREEYDEENEEIQQLSFNSGNESSRNSETSNNYPGKKITQLNLFNRCHNLSLNSATAATSVIPQSECTPQNTKNQELQQQFHSQHTFPKQKQHPFKINLNPAFHIPSFSTAVFHRPRSTQNTPSIQKKLSCSSSHKNTNLPCRMFSLQKQNTQSTYTQDGSPNEGMLGEDVFTFKRIIDSLDNFDKLKIFQRYFKHNNADCVIAIFNKRRKIKANCIKTRLNNIRRKKTFIAQSRNNLKRSGAFQESPTNHNNSSSQNSQCTYGNNNYKKRLLTPSQNIFKKQFDQKQQQQSQGQQSVFSNGHQINIHKTYDDEEQQQQQQYPINNLSGNINSSRNSGAMVTDPSPSTAGNILNSRKSLFYLDIKQDKTAITSNSGGAGIDKENLPNKSHILSSCLSPMRTHEDQI